MEKRIRVGFFSFTCCEGCMIQFMECLNKRYDKWMAKMDVVHFRALRKDKGKNVENLDIAFVEGAISTKSEKEKLLKIRKKSKKLVAFGSGAVSGYPSDQRNCFDSKLKKKISPVVKKLGQISKISPLNKFVKVDDEMDGCPVTQKEIIKKIDGYLKNA